ncbi:hypothetical protein [Tenacibaculum sp. UWU-22]|uniref:hypothetical protein n=1 Tax=Tenacibaculum sp. UWU-22 TaxID=3234187 RepID=UPI0034DB708E
MDKESTPKDEEIELGSLFIIIGKGFSNLFRFIQNIFRQIYHLFITLLLFLKRNAVKLIIAAIVGGVIGAFFELKKDVVYGADMLVYPNFKSTRQLYSDINYYNDLVKQKDTVALAETFHISKEDAAALKKFEIYPIKNNNDILNSYNELVLSDTLVAKNYSFNEFKNEFTQYDYKVHNIHVIAKKNNVFSKLDKPIISSVVENKYFNTIKSLFNANLNLTDSLLRKNLHQIDSLRKVYMKVLLEEAKKNNSGTNIDLGSTKKTVKELELFKTNREISRELKDISESKSKKTEVLNVISKFQPIGYKIKGFNHNYIFLFAISGVIIVLLFLMVKHLNNYLNNYKNSL